MKILSIDAETNGLYGQAFMISAIVVDVETNHIDAVFSDRILINGTVGKFVEENVLPVIEDVPIRSMSYADMLKDFIEFFLKWKDKSYVVVHMGVPVEAKLFIDAHEMGFLGDFDGPYPLIDVSAFPEINDSVELYAERYDDLIDSIKEQMKKIGINANTHNPIYDALVTAMVYLHYMKTHLCTT